MDMEILHPTFVVLPIKSLKYLVLAYEVLPLSLCYKFNGTHYLSEFELSNLAQKIDFDSKYVALELSWESENEYISFNTIRKFLFKDEFTLEDFLSKGLGDFDLSSVILDLINIDKNNYNEFNNIENPILNSKYDFVKLMMKVDGLTALLNITEDIFTLLNSSQLISCENILGILLGVEKKSNAESIIALLFAEQCFLYGADSGWKPLEIINNIMSDLPSELAENKNIKSWNSSVHNLISGKETKVSFEDSKIITLRAIILILLNPNIESIDRIIKSTDIPIGEQVACLAKRFAILRTGYSSFDSEQRNVDSVKRALIRDFRASYLNDKLSSFFSNLNGANTLEKKNNELYLQNLDVSADGFEKQSTDGSLAVESEKLHWMTQQKHGIELQYHINGLEPLSGFCLYIKFDNLGEFPFIVILDLTDAASEKKYTPGLCKQLLELQSELPVSTRFEKLKNEFVLTIRNKKSITELDKLEVENIIRTLNRAKMLKKVSLFGL